ncbi:hypothetical protein T4B_13958 [Trichinella pseudospiralis]|uniref:Uncharacterized protein n=1 Tax=Trichinella pseudospiralis TaxID=6337 RepID=A0A0V1GKY6_TRIPS|nr:hypothetical protein T4B_13958 [Trichinella pseudospiralis]
MLKDKDKRSSFNGILQGIEQAKLVQWHFTRIKTSEARSTAFYKGLSEKSKVDGIKTSEAHSMAFYNGLSEKSKTSEARSMAFYKGLSEKSKVHGDDFKNR